MLVVTGILVYAMLKSYLRPIDFIQRGVKDMSIIISAYKLAV